MLPRISETSNIPHISLSVALINLNLDLDLHTNQLHPVSHPIEALDSQTLVNNLTFDIANNYLDDINTDISKDTIQQELADNLVEFVELLKLGKLNEITVDMTVNQKAQWIESALNDRLYHLAMGYAI